jgi:hypothetical protein
MVTGLFTTMTNDDTGGWDDINAGDAAAYVRDVSEQLANMARMMGLEAVAAPLEQAHRAACDVLQEKAAPDDAA